ncbi:MAG TPA: FecR domain-containing protein, partial [Burkholderiales bacterium]|nr:FecR domain-containing protein [Burkholderiales bacterium]
GRIVSIQGDVRLLRAGAAAWVAVKRLDTALCQGDQLRTGLLSRAGVYLSPETLVRLDQNTTLELLGQSEAETVLAFRQEAYTRLAAPRAAGQCGAAYFISRFPRKLKVRTPFYNAVVEGTEFQVALSCDRGELAVFEGKVAAEALDAPNERVLLESGQATSVGAGETPRAIRTLVRPADAVQWALYYLPLSDVGELTEAALAQDCAALPPEQRSRCAIRKAEYLLRVGRAPEARAQLDALLQAEPHNADVLALQSIIALVQNDKAAALQLAQRATQAAPNAFRGFAALSYAQQAHFKLDDALTAAKRAAQLAPDSALLKARSAELQLSLGKIRAAEREAKEAVALNANEARAHLILGFVHLAQIDTKAAKVDFNHAIELDSTEPLARLGLGLATIREGQLEAGRQQIEIAVALDPTNSLLRSYVGKAYYEENSSARDQLAATQFGLAKALDPNDPTPWFYDAILKQTQNRPVEALQDLQQSIARNDNRAVYRSRLALDQDRATRGISLAQAFSVTGASVEAVGVAGTSVTRDPGNSAAHRFLADVYAAQDRHEVARTSELLQAQLLQPIDAPALPARLAYSDIDLPSRGLSDLGDHEYGRLFERPGARLSVSGLMGNEETQGSEVIGAIRSNHLALSVSRFGYSTDGFRPNNDLDHEIYDVFGMATPSPAVTLQAEYRKRRTTEGDIVLNFDPSVFDANLRRDLRQDTGRAGVTLRPSPTSAFVVSAIWSDIKDHTFTSEPGAFDLRIDAHDRGNLYEGQYQFSANAFNVVTGIAYSEIDTFLNVAFDWTPALTIPCLEPLFPCGSERRTNVRQHDAYAYLSLFPTEGVGITFGGSYDRFKDPPTKVEGFHPKLGMQARLNNWLSVRSAYFEALKRQLVVDQTIEPTQVAGFQQLYDDVNGSESQNLGVAVDFVPTPSLRIAAEFIKRNIDISGALFTSSLTVGPTETFHEQSVKLNGTWLAASKVSVLAGIEYEEFSWKPVTTFSVPIPVQLYATKLPVGLRYFLPQGFFGEVMATTVWQSIRRQATATLPSGSENFTVIDVLLGWRLPGRRGIVSLEVKNLFNTTFFYQDDNFRSTQIRLPPFVPERRVWLKGALWF